MLHYYRTVFRAAQRQTVRLIREQVLFEVMLLVIALIFSAALAPEGFAKILASFAGPAGVLLAVVGLLFLWSLARAPVDLAREDQKKIGELEALVSPARRLIAVCPVQGAGMVPADYGNTVWEIDAYLEVSTVDENRPLLNCRVKLRELEHCFSVYDKDRAERIESWNRDNFYQGQTYFFSWSGRPTDVDAVDIHRSERVSIAKCIETRPQLTTTAAKAGYLFYGDQYHLVVEITADNSLPLTKEYRLQLAEWNQSVIEEWDAGPRPGLTRQPGASGDTESSPTPSPESAPGTEDPEHQ